MLVCRIALKRYANELLAPGIAGRWNSEGRKVIYAAGSIALATVENFSYRKGLGFNRNFATMLIDVPDELAVTEYISDTLPAGWNMATDYSVSQPIGDRWYDEAVSAVLKVPSAIIPQEFNYILNSTHPDFAKIKLIAVTEYIPDPRIDEILKKYPKP